MNSRLLQALFFKRDTMEFFYHKWNNLFVPDKTDLDKTFLEASKCFKNKQRGWKITWSTIVTQI